MQKPVDGQLTHDGRSRRNSNSSAATFDLASANPSLLPEVESEAPLSIDEELATLRADKEHLTTIVADMQCDFLMINLPLSSRVAFL